VDLAGLQLEELFPHDQDPYGGVAPNDEPAKGAGNRQRNRRRRLQRRAWSPAQYLAHRYGARVTGIELSPARVTGVQKLTRRALAGGRPVRPAINEMISSRDFSALAKRAAIRPWIKSLTNPRKLESQTTRMGLVNSSNSP
jgi:hypothetical protein